MFARLVVEQGATASKQSFFSFPRVILCYKKIIERAGAPDALWCVQLAGYRLVRRSVKCFFDVIVVDNGGKPPSNWQ